jgi:outer membrane protein OmpA-like peptidoglycan-associated protein
MKKFYAKCLVFVFIAVLGSGSLWGQYASSVPDPPRNDNVALPQGSGEQFYIFFESYSTKATDEGLHIPSLYSVSTTLATVLKIMRDNPSYRLLIEGFANPTSGSKSEAAELLRLSTLRAREIESRFVRDGVARYRFITVGLGGVDHPDRSAIQQAKNRRVTMSIIRPNNGKLYRINFEPGWAAVTGAPLFAQAQIDSLQTILTITSYVKTNPNCRVLVQGYETPAESKVKRNTPISQQRANELARLLRKEFEREGIRNFQFIVSASANVEEPAGEIMILDMPRVP